MTARELSFVHAFRTAEGPDLPPVLLLHGTAGDETDLLPLGAAIAPGAAVESRQLMASRGLTQQDLALAAAWHARLSSARSRVTS